MDKVGLGDFVDVGFKLVLYTAGAAVIYTALGWMFGLVG